jgi:hypothetical protein
LYALLPQGTLITLDAALLSPAETAAYLGRVPGLLTLMDAEMVEPPEPDPR